MQDPAFRDEQHTRLRDPHIAPFTELIDELRTVSAAAAIPPFARAA